MASHRSTTGTNRRTALTALTGVVAVVASFLAIAGGLFAPSSANAQLGMTKIFRPRATVTATVRATATATVTVPGPTATVTATATATQMVPGPTQTVTATMTVPGPTQTVTASTIAPSEIPSSTATATQTPAPSLRFPGDPGLGSMYVGESVGGGNPSARESTWGSTVGAYRSYFQWNQNQQVVDRANRDLAAGRLPFISIKDSGSWANMASGAQDGILRDLMTRLAAIKGPVWLTIHHEPYDDQAAEGTAADFAAMNEHVMSMLPPNVALVPILQTAPFDPTVGGSQNIAAWYPPGSYTFVGLDTYNHRYYTPTAGNKYRDPATVLSIVDLVRKELNRPDVPIAIAEFGTRTNPAVPGQAAQWLRDFVSQAKSMNIPAVCYFDSGLNVNDGGTPWSLDYAGDGTNGTERLNAYGPLVAAGAHLH